MSRRRCVPLAGAAGLLLVGSLVAGCTGTLKAGRSTDATTSGPSVAIEPAPPTTPVQSESAALTGAVVDVVDGDTFVVTMAGGEERVRVLGIDTPERDECGFADATSAATDLLRNATITLIADPTQDDRDRYGRLVRAVGLPDGSDLGHQLVAGGFAREYTYDKAYARQADYRAAQDDAATAGRGLWAASSCGGFAAASVSSTSPVPSTVSMTSAGPTPPSPDCAIKGNISNNGRIYHEPDSRDYERTSVDESRGERWFCSTAEAEASGWRASGSG